MRSLEKAVELLRQLAADEGEHAISVLAAEIGLPPSTAYRIAATFERAGLVVRLHRGHYLLGPTLLGIAKPGSLNRLIAGVGRPIVQTVAKRTRCTAHLGVFEGGMVTYLLKVGWGKTRVFKREGTQLEDYCTGIGKVLLAGLPESELEDYLRNGPFIRLTPKTLTDPCALRAELAAVRAQGYATDDEEMDSGLRCFAVPVRNSAGNAIAALSIATRQANDLHAHLPRLLEAATALTQRVMGSGSSARPRAVRQEPPLSHRAAGQRSTR